MNAQVIMNCPACNAPVEPEEDLEVGESLECDQCEALLIVTSVEPLEVELDEDDDDDDEDEDDDDPDADDLEDDLDDDEVEYSEEEDDEEDD
jgi:hypothetical protein